MLCPHRSSGPGSERGGNTADRSLDLALGSNPVGSCIMGMKQWTLRPGGLVEDTRIDQHASSDPSFTQVGIGTHRVYLPCSAPLHRSDVASLWIVEHMPFPLCAPAYPTNTVFQIDAAAADHAFTKEEVHAFVNSVCNATRLGPQAIMRALKDVAFRSDKQRGPPARCVRSQASSSARDDDDACDEDIERDVTSALDDDREEAQDAHTDEAEDDGEEEDNVNEDEDEDEVEVENEDEGEGEGEGEDDEAAGDEDEEDDDEGNLEAEEDIEVAAEEDEDEDVMGDDDDIHEDFVDDDYAEDDEQDVDDDT